MSNADFIKKYGKFEFRAMCKDIPLILALAKAQKKIGGYKINNTKKTVKFYQRNKESIILEFALIFILGTDNIQAYIERREKLLEKS